MRVLTSAQAAEVAAGETSPQLLIQRAGYAVAQFCIAEFKFRSACVVCGRGSKGEVGVAAAAVLVGIAAKVWVIALAGQTDERSSDGSDGMSQSIRPIRIQQETDFDSEAVREALAADLIIDAIAGPHVQKPLSPTACAAIAAVNRASGIVVSVDVPSGVDADSPEPARAYGGNMVFAQGVLALLAPKPAHVFGDLTPGPTAVSEIGVQPAVVRGDGRLSVLTGRDVCIAFPRRSPGTTEVEFGHVLIVGGARGSAGAAALGALAALRSGAGRVTVACPRSVEATVAAFSPALLTHALPETTDGGIAAMAGDEIGRLLAGKQAAVVGPGLSVDPETVRFVGQLMATCQIPLVIGAGGLAAFSGRCAGLDQSTGREAFRAICADISEVEQWLSTSLDNGDVQPPDLARSISRMTNACVVLRGSRTEVAGLCGETWVNLSGSAALAKAGMSEVLAGIMGAALARGSGGDFPGREEPAFHFSLLRDLHVAAAVHLHGLAADIACNMSHEHALMAEDVVEALPRAFRACDRQAESGLFYLRS